MNTDALTALIGWHWDAFHVAAAVAVLGRIWRHAGGVRGLWQTLTTRGGIVGICRALLFGTNTNPPQKP